VQACRAAGASEAFGVGADATDAPDLARAIRESTAALGGLAILVPLVGGRLPGGTELEDAGWELALGRNLWPAIPATRLALPLLEASARERGVAMPASVDAPGSRQQSVVLHVASIWGREGGGFMSCNAAKAALISLTHEQARELAPRGVRVLSIAPGSALHAGGAWAPGPSRSRGVHPAGDSLRPLRHGRGGRRCHRLPLESSRQLDRRRVRRGRRRPVAGVLEEPQDRRPKPPALLAAGEERRSWRDATLHPGWPAAHDWSRRMRSTEADALREARRFIHADARQGSRDATTYLEACSQGEGPGRHRDPRVPRRRTHAGRHRVGAGGCRRQDLVRERLS
jgi:NAD(P)-dependent dehydrogenase (short-subunit alcohol dehydrogenase family)